MQLSLDRKYPNHTHVDAIQQTQHNTSCTDVTKCKLQVVPKSQPYLSLTSTIDHARVRFKLNKT